MPINNDAITIDTRRYKQKFVETTNLQQEHARNFVRWIKTWNKWVRPLDPALM